MGKEELPPEERDCSECGKGKIKVMRIESDHAFNSWEEDVFLEPCTNCGSDKIPKREPFTKEEWDSLMARVLKSKR